MKKGNSLRGLLTLFLVALLCFGNVTGVKLPTDIYAQAAAVSISQKSASIVIGEKLNLSVSGTTKKVKWKSSDKKIATVSSSGAVKGKKAGKATITATVGKKKYKCKVTVKIGLSERDIHLSIGETKSVSLKGAKVKSFKSSNNSIATVTKKGLITAVSEGTAKITCKAKNGKNYKCNVTVENPQINKARLDLIVGQSETLSVNTSKSLTWSSANTGVATVDQQGNVTGAGYGSTQVTATAGGRSYTCDVYVTYDSNAVYTITFDCAGGTPAVPSQQVHGNGRVEVPVSPSLIGYSFSGWYLNDRAYDFNTPVGSSFTLVAHYSELSDNLTDEYTDLGDILYLQSIGKIQANYEEGGVVGSIDGKFTDEIVTDTGSAINVLNNAEAIIAGKGGNFRAEASQTSVQENNTGSGVERFYKVAQVYDGIPVIGNEVILATASNGEVTGLFNNFDNKLNEVSTYTYISESEAEAAAISALMSDEKLNKYLGDCANGTTYTADDLKTELQKCLETSTRLVIYAPDDTDPTLYYEVTIKADPSRWTIASIKVDSEILFEALDVVGETEILEKTTEDSTTGEDEESKTTEENPTDNATEEAATNATDSDSNVTAPEEGSSTSDSQESSSAAPANEEAANESSTQEDASVEKQATENTSSDEQKEESTEASQTASSENLEDGQSDSNIPENETELPADENEDPTKDKLEEDAELFDINPENLNESIDGPAFPTVDRSYYVCANNENEQNAGTVAFFIENGEGISITEKDHRNQNRNIEVTQSNGKYKLQDTRRNINTYKVGTSSFLFWKSPQTPGDFELFTSGSANKTAVSAHANMETVYDYYKNVLGRNSFDNHGKEIKVTYDYFNEGFWKGDYYNAYWTSGGQQFVIGNDGNLADGLDVLGHEFTHAVVGYVVGNGTTTSLTYYGESGALNESYADIMGNLIENNSGSGRWELGEDTDSAIRDMSNPGRYNQPAHYNNRYTGNSDNGGVHKNSGIFNHAAYLMMTDSRTSSVSRDTWARVFYNSLFELGTDSDFLAGRRAVLYAANKLGLTADQQQAIRDAFDNVGISELNVVQITLTWGENPSDLDSHLVKLDGNGGKTFHIAYFDKTYKENGKYMADLDYDDTTSFGPENTTIYDMTPGVYYFFVHDYSTGDDASSNAMAQSNAKIKIFKAGNILKEYSVSPSSSGTIWTVCRIEINGNGNVTIQDVNTYSGGDQNYPEYATLNSGLEATDEAAVLDQIMEEILSSRKE